MGIEMATPFQSETYETLGQAWIWPNKQQQVDASASTAARTASLKRRTGAQRALRKSCSERPLNSPVRGMELLTSTGSANVLDVDDSNTVNPADEDDEQRRLRITARAEEILRGKRCVGMLVGATCPVCLTDDVDTQLSECGHLIHAKCIKRWIQSGTCCPVCREEVVDVEEAFTSPAKMLHPMTKDRLTSSSEATCLPEDEEDNRTEDAGYDWGWFEDFDDTDDVSDNSSEIFRIVEAKNSKAQHAEYLIEMQLDGRYFSRWRRFSEIYRFVCTLDQNRFRQTLAAWQPLDANSRWFNRLELSYLHKRCRMLEEFAHALLIECSNAHPLAELVEC
ncbi:hypothetical protein AM588_10001879 [Phytophthora nicotianae]|uniref:RING-type domain-containing protein n=1 Tax=Phytophthora nicotianae TaxID=4792 RepID=A0A0W8CX09_PHYNI|nr:hypothetical protein AM588_10001879 [Phytophthora nicotianae]